MSDNNKNIKVNALYNMIKVVAQIIFPLITFPYVTRVLGPKNIGQVNYANSIYSYIALIGSLSVSTYAIRTCSVARSNRQDLDQTASEIFSINILSTIVAYAVMGAVLLVPKFAPYRVFIIIYCVNILTTTIGADWINSAMEDFKYITIRTVAFQFLSLILMFLFVRNSGDNIKYVIISVIATSGANIVNMFYRRRFCEIRFTLAFKWNKHLSPILKFFASVITQQIYVNSDIVMIGWMITDQQVGLYSTASKIFNIVNTMLASIFTVALPRASQYWMEEKYDKYNALLRKIILFLIGIGLPCVFGLMFASREIIYIVGGPEYLSGSMALSIFSLALFFSFFHGFIGNLIVIPLGDFNIGIIAALASSAANIVLNLILLPKFGFTAAAFTTMIAELISALVFGTRISKKIKIHSVTRNVIHSLVGCIGLTVWIFATRVLTANDYIRFIVIMAGGAIIYGVVLAIFKDEFLEEALGMVRRRLHR